MPYQSLNGTKMKVKLLNGSHWYAVFGRRAKRPSPHCFDDRLLDAVPKGMKELEVGDLAGGVDGDIKHHFALHPGRQTRKVRLRAWRIGGQGDLNIVCPYGIARGS